MAPLVQKEVKQMAYGPHVFPKNADGALAFREFLLHKFPKMWKDCYDTPLLDKKGYITYAPKKSKECVF